MKGVNKFHTRCLSFNVIPLDNTLLKNIKINVIISHIYNTKHGVVYRLKEIHYQNLKMEILFSMNKKNIVLLMSF